MASGVPKDRVAAIRAAYVQTLKDPEFVATVRKGGLEIDPISADELADTVRHIYAQPAAAVADGK
jgi:tripartite-type tricarboxylate transporter receptor subunit TctC